MNVVFGFQSWERTHNSSSAQLTGLVFCADCGAKMYNHRTQSGTARKDGSRVPVDRYCCSTYTLAKGNFTNNCSQHSIQTKAIQEVLLHTIREVCTYAISNPVEFAKRLQESSDTQHQEQLKELEKQVKKNKKRCEELNVLLKSLYESFILGELSEKRYDLLSADYEAEQETLERAIREAESVLTDSKEEAHNAQRFLSLAGSWTEFNELTPEMVNQFVDKIVIHEADKSSGERIQQIDIYLNFIGDFSIPQPALTEEQLAAEEKERQERIQRKSKRAEYNRRHREKVKRMKEQTTTP